jgi:Ca2+ transporting ATPase
MEGKKFRELVGGLIFENPEGKTIREKGECKVKNLDNFKSIAKELKVLARSSPEDKYILVTGLI